MLEEARMFHTLHMNNLLWNSTFLVEKKINQGLNQSITNYTTTYFIIPQLRERQARVKAECSGSILDTNTS